LRYDNVRLAGLPISSNSTGMVHSEQMLTLDGPIRLGQSSARRAAQIENRTKMALRSVCVVRRPTREESEQDRRGFEGRWIGQMLPGQSIAIAERMPNLLINRVPFMQKRLDEGRRAGAESLNLEPMFRLALDPQHIEQGETRLVARVDEVMPGQTITPTASQVRGATLVIAHLQYAPSPPPRKDLNTRRDFKADTDEPEEDEPVELEF
jgi:hypothetical protein